jgi:methylated-DNA-protein-cysteine methyltransferase related protein
MDSKRKNVAASWNSKAVRSESGWARVYAVVKKIPRGHVVTYGQLAKALRLPGGARTAGRAMAGCKSGSGVPWHRVLGSGGHILLREPVAALQRRLLESEGVKFAGLRVAMKAHGWTIPTKARKKRGGRKSNLGRSG